MKPIVILGALLMCVSAFASTLNKSRLPANVNSVAIQCSTPKGFAGLSANVSGSLKLSPMPNGAAKATGKLKISLMNPRNPWSEEKMVLGQYDDLTSVGSDRYFHGGATVKDANDIMEIFVNFTRGGLSFVEYDGTNYKMDCK
ncbi:MAG: hypothetical protein JSU04_19615 [Bdellovibrionales bacterium]|nr:hypothetical protein [Bdellovibrionales bacterium]